MIMYYVVVWLMQIISCSVFGRCLVFGFGPGVSDRVCLVALSLSMQCTLRRMYTHIKCIMPSSPRLDRSDWTSRLDLESRAGSLG
jgi:hypothetical protein